MTKKSYSFYPGCTFDGTGRPLDQSLRAILPRLDVELTDLDDWNCCGTSVGQFGGGTLAVQALNGRNLALAEQQAPERDMAISCPACFIHTEHTNREIKENEKAQTRINEALGAGGMNYKGTVNVRHIVEIMTNDVGVERIKQEVKTPLNGLKVAGYVGCQTLRPYKEQNGGKFDNPDNPRFLDDFIDATGAEAISDFSRKTACCGGAVTAVNPQKTLHLVRDILGEAADKGADVICTPCALCQTNVEMNQKRVNERFGTNFNIPVVYYSQMMALSFGMDPKKDAALDQHLISPDVVLKAGGK